MKKIIALILAMAMALALVACGGDNTTPDAKDNQTPAAGSTIYVMGPTPRPRLDRSGWCLCPG